jgi:hypothetical protein
MGRRVLVCGGRDYRDRVELFACMDALHKSNPISCIIHGGAKGADSLAGKWASERGIHCEVFPADWRFYGRSAGPIRNQEMLTIGRPDLVVAFPGGRGTANMVRRADDADVPVIELRDGNREGE